MKYDRIQKMEEYIMKNKSVSNEELQQHFLVSIQTLRRDLKELERRNVISKVYGGVVWINEPVEKNEITPWDQRITSNQEEKQCIGKLASELVEDNDVIFVDSGTTACTIIPYLKNRNNVTVISHSLDVLNALIRVGNVKGICLGGTLRNDTCAFLADTSFYPYNYNKAFISTVGISVNKGLTNTDIQEGLMKQHVIQHSEEVYIVADHSKFDVVAYNHFANLSGIQGLITDRIPKEKYMRLLSTLNIRVIAPAP